MKAMKTFGKPFGFILKFFVAAFAAFLILMGGFSAAADSDEQWWRNAISVKDDYKGSTAAIICMDVSSDEQILLTLSNKTLLLLDSNGDVQKAFEFDSYGSYYALFSDLTNNIQLYFVRGGSCIEFTTEGEISKHFYQSGDFAWARNLPTELNVNGNTYKISKAPLTITAERFALLTKTDSFAEESVLYDVYASQLFRNILLLSVFIIGFTCIPMIILIANVSYAKVRRELFPAPKKAVKPATPAMKALKWSVFALVAVKFVFTFISVINFRAGGISCFAIQSVFQGWMIGARYIGEIGAILFPAMGMLLLTSLGVGEILLLALKRKPLPSLFLIGIPTAVDCILMPTCFASASLSESVAGLILNFVILGLLTAYTIITKKNFRS